MKTFKIDGDDISDGYHTFGELYDHRCLLFINLCLLRLDWAAWRPDYKGWFCLYLETPAGQISYHIPDKFLSLVSSKIKRDDEYKWDGHTSSVVAIRLEELAT